MTHINSKKQSQTRFDVNEKHYIISLYYFITLFSSACVSKTDNTSLPWSLNSFTMMNVWN